MDLPYFTLKNTKIGYVYPNAFLVDMYSKSNSILFTFKSQYTKPVVIGKNARITFSFSAKVEKPFYTFGGMRVLIFPYALTEEGRDVRITVSLNSKLPVVAAPQVASSLKQKGIFPVTNETGKVFVFADSTDPYSLSFTNTAEVALPTFNQEQNCMLYQPVSCSGCGDILSNEQNGQLLAQRNKSAKSVVFQFAATTNPQCAEKQFSESTVPQSAGKSFRAGFIISPMANQLIPATWRVHESESGNFATSFLVQGIPYHYADPFGFLSIPLFSCTVEDDCRSRAESLQTVETSITSDKQNLPGLEPATTENLQITITQHQRQFSLHLKNLTNKFIAVDQLGITDNQYFASPTSQSHLILPTGSIDILLTPKQVTQYSNHYATLEVLINQQTYTVKFKPATITLLALIEALSYLFIASVGITLISLLGIIVYTRYYGKRNEQTVS